LGGEPRTELRVLHVWVIVIFAALVVHDAMPRMLVGSAVPHSVSALITLGIMGVLIIVQGLILRAAATQLASNGSMRSVLLAERGLTAMRVLAVISHVAAVLVFGWLDAVRSVIGDLIIIDELLAMTPALAVLACGWWSYYPIDRQFREATIVRSLDQGRPMYPIPTRGQWTFSNVRHQLLLSLLPLAMIGAWTELSPRVLGWFQHMLKGTAFDRALRGEDSRVLIELAMQMGGALVVFALTPLIMRHVWDTVRLGPGSVRDRLMGMCTQRGVRVRELLVWRTHGSMINGAVMGLAGPLRYVLLTDALLDQLPEDQVEAVMAHEIAHAKHAHLPWLAGTLIASIGSITAAGMYALSAAGNIIDTDAIPDWLVLVLSMGVQIGGLVAGVLVFGHVSRRFEWQADAFAARHLSASSVQEPCEASHPTISREGAGSMIAALESVARLNHVPRNLWTFRHGSIGDRQRRLWALIGTRVDHMPIDRSARWIKAAVLCAGLLMVGTLVTDAWRSHSASSVQPQSQHIRSPGGR
jgi:STE24 endopeptidase